MNLFSRKSWVSAPIEEDESQIASLRIREERLERLQKVTEVDLARRERELEERETMACREQAKLRDWAMQLADAAGHLKELFGRCDRFGVNVGATAAQVVAEKALSALRPDATDEDRPEPKKTVIRAGEKVADHDDPDSNDALMTPESSVSGAGMVLRLPGMEGKEVSWPHLKCESVLYADMKRLWLLPGQHESMDVSTSVFDLELAG